VVEREAFAMTQTRTANERSNLRLRFRERRTGASFLDIDAWIPSEIKAVSPLVDRLMRLIEGTHCVAGEEPSIHLALHEVLNNAVVHGNGMDPRKLVHVRCRCELGRGVSLIVSDQGKGFNPDAVPNPLSVENLEAEHGRGIHFIKSVMDEVSFARGGTEVRMWKAARDPGTELQRSSQGL
jgi:serine/threonine-protein kinase RsbW